jgi:radical SAM superfamily enzyme YgiQ (UPF0313 family)
MMKVLLVYPEYPVTFWSFDYALKFISKKAAYPPLGLLTVAAMLPDDWEVRLMDLNVEKLKDADLKWADYVMISAMLIQKKSVFNILAKCRSLATRVIAGGPLFNSTPDEYIDLVDHLILNEAELTLPPFLADLRAGNPKKVYRTNAFPEMNLTPTPRWDLIKIEKYATLMIQCSRGCPFDCEFCDITALYGRRARVKNADQLMKELEAIYNLGWRNSVFIVDDNFIGNKGKIKKMLPRLIHWMQTYDYPFQFITEASINLADDDELIELMAEAGFNRVFIGLETPNEESLEECSKHQNRDRNMVDAIKKLQAENRLRFDVTGDNTDGTINFIPRMDKETLIKGYRKIVRTIYSPRFFYRRASKFLEHYQPRRKSNLEDHTIKTFLKSVFYLGIVGNGISQWYFWKMVCKSLLFHRKLLPDAITLMIFGYHFRKVSKRV